MTLSELTGDEIRTELAAIVDALIAADDRDFATRAALRGRQQALRQEIGSRPAMADEVESLRRELDRLKVSLDRHLDARPNVAAMSDGGEGGGNGLAESQQLVWDYDESTGWKQIRSRIGAIERRLARAAG
jgi:HAMP domain-containing protein